MSTSSGPIGQRDPVRIASKKQKSQILSSQEQCCLDCKSILMDGEFEFHHIEHHARGGVTEFYNLVALCKACHGGRHGR